MNGLSVCRIKSLAPLLVIILIFFISSSIYRFWSPNSSYKCYTVTWRMCLQPKRDNSTIKKNIICYSNSCFCWCYKCYANFSLFMKHWKKDNSAFIVELQWSTKHTHITKDRARFSLFFSHSHCRFCYSTLHLCHCQRPFNKIFVKFRNSKKMYLKLFWLFLIIVNINKDENKSLISNEFSLKNDFPPTSWRTILRR
jgi:hypothetical protein